MTRHHENVKVFLAFSDITRLKILEILRSGEQSATELQQQIGAGQSTLSHHMKILIDSRVVVARKAGKWTYYSICETGGDYASRLIKLLTSKSKAVEATSAFAAVRDKRRLGNMKPFTIVVDTSCDLPSEYIKEYGIETIPIPFTLNGEEHSMGYWQNISDKEFYDTLRNGGKASTTLINPDSFLESFTKHAKQGQDVLYIILSSALSGTYQSALIALEQVKETYPDCNICLVDSVGATSINGLLAMLAVKKREEGLSAEETAAWLEEKKHSLIGLFTVDDLMYLHRGGRLSKLSAIGGSILSIKPVLNIQPDGSLSLKDKVRGRASALKLMISQLKRSLHPDTALDTVLIPHTDCEDDARKLAEMIQAEVQVRQVLIMTMGPVIGAHVGPGAIAVVFEADMTREEHEEEF
ncbi:MAG: metalloregulator ArsR/SmtB family transcription factor [Oscillospiraceae bacterium]|nr:metalloregulator ArsR/SmtB family transcription factor [Oscillospiraceae bacterium]